MERGGREAPLAIGLLLVNVVEHKDMKLYFAFSSHKSNSTSLDFVSRHNSSIAPRPVGRENADGSHKI
eukprot:scaffold208554_cov35-Tisochrysis_lutea.AAC.1